MSYLLVGILIGLMTVAPLAQGWMKTPAGVTMTDNPAEPQVRITCLRHGTVAVEIDDMDGNVLHKIVCP
jgi:hypothetical protein